MLRVLMFALLAAGADPVFEDFLCWYRTYQGSFMPPEVTKAYGAKLQTDGIEPGEIERRLGIIRKTVSTMPPEFTELHFDHIYQSPQAPFKDATSQFLVRASEGRKPGRALDVAMGQGRNALYLASQGWDVTGYDLSEQGLGMARARAAKLGLKLKTVHASHDQFEYGREQWDLIVETFAFTTLSDATYRRRVIDALKPGGMLVIEGFGGGPNNVYFEGFKELRFVLYEDKVEVADWGLEESRLVRFAAIKE